MEQRLLAAKEPLFWIFRGWKIQPFLSQKVDGKMTFIDYWKDVVLDFSGMENTVFFWDKKLMKRWYLLITEMFLFWTFQGRKIRSFFEAKSWSKDDTYQLMKSFCFELFRDGKCGLFWDKTLMERWYLLITKKFMFWATKKFLFWTFRWWEYGLFLAKKLM